VECALKKSSGEFDKGNDIVRQPRQKGGYELDRKHSPVTFLASNGSRD
jgi:hypothetical protein